MKYDKLHIRQGKSSIESYFIHCNDTDFLVAVD